MGCERKQRLFLVSCLLSCLANCLITNELRVNDKNFFVSLREMRNSFVVLWLWGQSNQIGNLS